MCLPKSWAGNYRNVGVYRTSSQHHPQSGLSSWSHPAECDGNDIFASWNIAKISTSSKQQGTQQFISITDWLNGRCWNRNIRQWNCSLAFLTINSSEFWILSSFFLPVCTWCCYSTAEYQLKDCQRLKYSILNTAFVRAWTHQELLRIPFMPP